MTVELPADVLTRLRAEATRRGVSIDAIIAELVAQLPPEQPVAAKRSLAFIAAGSSNGGITHRIDELLADGFGRD